LKGASGEQFLVFFAKMFLRNPTLKSMGRIDMRQLCEMLYSLWTLAPKQFWSEKIRSEISDGNTPSILVVKK